MKKHPINFSFFIMILVGISAPISCIPNPSDLCSQKFISVRQDVTQSLQKLDASKGEIRGADEERNGERSSDEWSDWAMSHLNEIQKFTDLVGTDSRFHEIELRASKLSHLWVEFFGYSERKNKLGMVQTLKKIQTLHQSIHTVACQ